MRASYLMYESQKREKNKVLRSFFYKINVFFIYKIVIVPYFI